MGTFSSFLWCMLIFYHQYVLNMNLFMLKWSDHSCQITAENIDKFLTIRIAYVLWQFHACLSCTLTTITSLTVILSLHNWLHFHFLLTVFSICFVDVLRPTECCLDYLWDCGFGAWIGPAEGTRLKERTTPRHPSIACSINFFSLPLLYAFT